MPPLRIGAAHPGKAFMQVSTLEIFLNVFIHHWAKEPIMSLTMATMLGL
jgi:hypothetical protein